MLDNASDKRVNLKNELDSNDYYFNSHGLMVFTEQYHLKRGYCCKSSCRHCPWNYSKRNINSGKR
ncbi:MAG: DUF5522 domain-containing protein [Candidatus Kapaibacterium sp.]